MCSGVERPPLRPLGLSHGKGGSPTNTKKIVGLLMVFAFLNGACGDDGGPTSSSQPTTTTTSALTSSTELNGSNPGASVCDPVDDPDVRTQGFWKRQCQGPHPSGENDNLPDYVDSVNDSATFADVGDEVALCDRLDPDPKNDKCEQAEAQFMALLLNLASGRVATCNCIADPDLGQTTVGEAADFIDVLLSNPGRAFEDCVLAQAIADRINNGLTLVACP